MNLLDSGTWFFLGLIVGLNVALWALKKHIIKEDPEDHPGYEETGLTVAEWEALTPEQKKAYSGSIILEDLE